MNTKAIGFLLRSERISQGITGEELGARIGIGKAQISKIENGNITTIKPLSKAAEALGVKLELNLKQEKILDKKIAGYIIACINMFAKTYRITVREATNYLTRYKGVDFLIKHYEAEHLLSLDETVQDLAVVCHNNNGGIL